MDKDKKTLTPEEKKIRLRSAWRKWREKHKDQKRKSEEKWLSKNKEKRRAIALASYHRRKNNYDLRPVETKNDS